VLERVEVSQPSVPKPEVKAETAPQRSGLLWQGTNLWTPSNEVGMSPASFTVLSNCAPSQEEHLKVPLTPSEALAAATAVLSDASDADGTSPSKRDSGSSTRTLRPSDPTSPSDEATYTPWGTTAIPLGAGAGLGRYSVPLFSTPPALDEIVNVRDSPLTPTEAEMFRSLCVLGEDPVSSTSDEQSTLGEQEEVEIDLDPPMAEDVVAPTPIEPSVVHPTRGEVLSEGDEAMPPTIEPKCLAPKTRAAVAAAAAAARKPKCEPTRRSTRLAGGPSDMPVLAVRTRRSKAPAVGKKR